MLGADPKALRADSQFRFFVSAGSVGPPSWALWPVPSRPELCKNEMACGLFELQVPESAVRASSVKPRSSLRFKGSAFLMNRSQATNSDGRA